jgi:hypothetical protein
MDMMDMEYGRKTACYNCQRMLGQELHGKDGCHYHSGVLMTNGSLGTAANTSQAPRWSCCSLPGSNRGCHWGRHLLKRSAVEQVWRFTVSNILPKPASKRWRSSESDTQDATGGCAMEEAAASPYRAKRQRMQVA